MKKDLLLILLVITVNGDIEGDELVITNEKSSKENMYKKFVGETNYGLPFKTRISQPFNEGQTIHALGIISENPQRIDFNFHRGSGDNADIPLHLSIRFDEGLFSGKIVYNTFEHGNWSDNEQRINNPFKANEPFDIRVRILDGKYQVFANRVKVGTFEQRTGLDGVNHVSINGDLSNLKLFHYGGRAFKVPYTAVAKVIPGKRLDISGQPKGKRIDVSLLREDKDQAFELSIRFDEGVAVRNSMENHQWGREERSGNFPITKGEIFDLTIVNEKFSFQIFFNQERFCAFSHRSSPDDIEYLVIAGDIDLQSVTINDVLES